MITVLDIETSFQRNEDDDNPSPFINKNKLVSIGYKTDTGLQDYIFVYHELSPEIVDQDAKAKIQRTLDSTELLVCHNIKFDLEWLLECGFVYEGKTWDTMLCEYVLARGQKLSLKLGDCCERYGLPTKKAELIDEYLAKGISFERIPANLVKEYGIHDVDITYDLYLSQQEALKLEDNERLVPTIDMSNEFVHVLIEMERNGICIDRAQLNKFKDIYSDEQYKIKQRLEEIVSCVMGDRPYNINSPEQLSEIIYSRRVLHKDKWKEIFNIGSEQRGSVVKKKYAAKLKPQEFINAIRENTEIIFKEKASQCIDCQGRGKYSFTTKKGTESSVKRICKSCGGGGICYSRSNIPAGFKLIPLGANYASIGGFRTDNDTIKLLEKSLNNSDNHKLAKEFFTLIQRYAVLDTYLTSFIPGIEKGIYDDGLLHTQFMQTVTATGRLSSRRPNFHNQPRGNAFPLRRVVISRWQNIGGLIGEADYSQLEFRTAVQMANDEQGRSDILSGFDIHRYTASILTETAFSGVTSDQRQDAKPSTFKPLYGGVTGTSKEMEYFRAFLQKYDGINSYQQKLQNEAIRNKKIFLPSGREYAFPGAKRRWDGSSTFATQIKNYPVQGFATADIVPCAAIEIRSEIKKAKLKSLILNIIHDSIKLDIYPGELDIIAKLVLNTMINVKNILLKRYNYIFDIPLDAEFKYGQNWLDTQKWKY